MDREGPWICGGTGEGGARSGTRNPQRLQILGEEGKVMHAPSCSLCSGDVYQKSQRGRTKGQFHDLEIAALRVLPEGHCSGVPWRPDLFGEVEDKLPPISLARRSHWWCLAKVCRAPAHNRALVLE